MRQEKLFLQSSWIILHQETAGKEKWLEKYLEIRNCAQSVNDSGLYISFNFSKVKKFLTEYKQTEYKQTWF